MIGQRNDQRDVKDRWEQIGYKLVVRRVQVKDDEVRWVCACECDASVCPRKWHFPVRKTFYRGIFFFFTLSKLELSKLRECSTHLTYCINTANVRQILTKTTDWLVLLVKERPSTKGVSDQLRRFFSNDRFLIKCWKTGWWHCMAWHLYCTD